MFFWGGTYVVLKKSVFYFLGVPPRRDGGCVLSCLISSSLAHVVQWSVLKYTERKTIEAHVQLLVWIYWIFQKPFPWYNKKCKQCFLYISHVIIKRKAVSTRALNPSLWLAVVCLSRSIRSFPRQSPSLSRRPSVCLWINTDTLWLKRCIQYVLIYTSISINMSLYLDMWRRWI